MVLYSTVKISCHGNVIELISGGLLFGFDEMLLKACGKFDTIRYVNWDRPRPIKGSISVHVIDKYYVVTAWYDREPRIFAISSNLNEALIHAEREMLREFADDEHESIRRAFKEIRESLG